MGQAPFFFKTSMKRADWGMRLGPTGDEAPVRALRPVDPVRTILAPFGSGLGPALRHLFEVTADLFLRATKPP